MKIKTKQIPWNVSMTANQVYKLVKKYPFDRKFHHAYLGDAYIGYYGNWINSHPPVFKIDFEHCPGKAYVTLEELLNDELCMQAYGAEREEIDRIFGPYVAYQKARREEDERNYYEEELLKEAEDCKYYFRTGGLLSSTETTTKITTEIKKEPRKSIRIVIRRSSSDDENVVEPQGQSTRTTKLTSVP